MAALRLVQQAALAPHRCSAVPFIGNTNAKKGFIDLEVDAREMDHLYLSVAEAVEPMARMIGFQPQHVASVYRVERDAARTRIAELEAELAEVRETLAAVEVLKGAGFTQAKRPGRPRKEKVNA